MKCASEFIEKGSWTVDLSGSEADGIAAVAAGGLTVCPLNEARAKYGDILKNYLPDAQITASGLFVYAPDEVKEEAALNIVVGGKTSSEECWVVAGAGSSVKITFIMTGGVNVLRRIVVGSGAKVVARDIVAADAPMRLESLLREAEGSYCETVTAEIGEAQTDLVYRTELAGVNSESVHYGIFMSADMENKSVDVRVEHLVPDCKSDVLIKGVASGSGRGSFTGMVYVAKDAQRTEAYQQSRNIIIGDRARILTSPQLEIYADDVRCSHGATVGQMNDDAVYYMRQRGLSDAEARGLQLSGFVNDIVTRLGEGELADKVAAAASKKIDRLQNNAE